MRILIIGCGYVGSALAEQLLACGAEVYAVRRSTTETPPPSLSKAHWFTVDITQKEAVHQLAGAWDAVVNCVSSSRGGVEVYQRVFLEAGRYLREVFSAQPPRLHIHLSSTSVYGQTTGEWVTEDSPTEPNSETGRILVATERLWLDASDDGLPVRILRLAGIYGPGRCYWLNQFLSGSARLGEGDGRFLNMIHRQDVVQAILKVLEQPKAAGARIYNVVDNEPVPLRELYQGLAHLLKRPLPPEAVHETSAPRKRALTNKRVSNRRLKTELGWAPSYPSWREGFREEIQRLQAAGLLPPLETSTSED